MTRLSASGGRYQARNLTNVIPKKGAAMIVCYHGFIPSDMYLLPCEVAVTHNCTTPLIVFLVEDLFSDGEDGNYTACRLCELDPTPGLYSSHLWWETGIPRHRRTLSDTFRHHSTRLDTIPLARCSPEGTRRGRHSPCVSGRCEGASFSFWCWY